MTGFGEAVALVLRLGTGRLSDRTEASTEWDQLVAQPAEEPDPAQCHKR